MVAFKQAFSTGWRRLRALTLRSEGSMLAGVCTGLAEATPLAAWMWRVLFCATVLTWGWGILAYLILWLCVPKDPDVEYRYE